jgi:hypothetical protein
LISFKATGQIPIAPDKPVSDHFPAQPGQAQTLVKHYRAFPLPSI